MGQSTLRWFNQSMSNDILVSQVSEVVEYSLSGGLVAQVAVIILYLEGDDFQYASPSSVVARGSWTDQAGGTVNIFQSIDESSPDDANYIQSSEAPAGDICEIGIPPLADPEVSDNHVVSYRIAKSVAGAQINMTVALMQGSTEIAAWTHTDIGTTFVTYEQTLTAGQADSITDYSNLRLRFTATQV